MIHTPETALLRVSGVTVRFGGLKAVDDVSFEAYPGELLGLIGPNGAGKTTLMRAITGVVGANAGSIQLSDQDLTRLPTHQRIRKGLAFSQQLVRPFRQISVLDNVALAAGARHTHSPMKALLHTDSRHERDIARRMLARVGISRHADQMPGIQPLGVLKRLEVARALAQEPKLLLLDEPLAGLNSKEAATLADTIAEINRQGITIILIEHNLGEVMRICQRLVVLDNGRRIASGAPREVMQQPQVRAAYLGAPAESTEEHSA
ncbi:ABC transporter ATP-binding protein [Pusillimonas caeni]|uniref:ABC transporter ATP-binding protein n=1 Tax=Pusillimonas caeni TaxID=1348472 RepID=UPI000E59FA0D|nr:ABC transporter ATP-binding protein [Pusillimonas caeni]TFL15466.1 ABC transporter ATP-binding protein [Pusillimonas caeni]